jgi:hypothetical protein
MSSHIADVSSITYFAPILAFLIVFVIMYALLRKTQILGEERFTHLFIAFLIATVFVTAASVRQIVLNVVPWFAVLVIALFFILVLAGFIGKPEEIIGKRVGWIFVIVLILIFLISGIKVFSSSLGSYLPGPYYGAGGDQQILFFLDWLYSPRIVGAALLLGVAAVVSWVLVKSKKK